jgi:hypothetical protein
MDQGSRFLALFVSTLALLTLPLVGPGCIQDLGTDVANTDTSSSASTSDDASSGSATGINCDEDPTTGITLCSGISECSSISVDPSALGGCGFRIHSGSAVIDLECLCGTSLCPIGVPDTCAEAMSLLSGLTSLVVCEGASEGKCVQEDAAEAGTGTSTTATGPTSTTSTCNNECLVSCGAAPDCQQLCGC